MPLTANLREIYEKIYSSYRPSLTITALFNNTRTLKFKTQATFLTAADKSEVCYTWEQVKNSVKQPPTTESDGGCLMSLSGR